jgi:hypothetical protein
LRGASPSALPLMDTTRYVLCRIEDDSSLTPISEHEDISAGVAAGKHRVEVEDFGYALVADGMKVAGFADGLRRRPRGLSGVGTQEREAPRHPQP